MSGGDSPSSSSASCFTDAFATPVLPLPLPTRRSAEDLRRARVQEARCVFVVSDRLAPDTEAQDKTALVRALCANQASPPGGPSVLCLVTHIKSKNRLVRLGMPPASVVCYDEVMEGLVTHACLVRAEIFFAFILFDARRERKRTRERGHGAGLTALCC